MNHTKILSFVFLVALATASVRADVVFDGPLCTLTLDEKGRSTSLREKATGRELVAYPAPFVVLTDADGKDVAPESLVCRGGGRYAVVFPDGRGEFSFSCAAFEGGWILTAGACTVKGWQRLAYPKIATVCCKYQGWASNLVSDDASGVVTRAFDPRLDMSCGNASYVVAVAERGVKGLKCGLVAGPRATLVPSLKSLTKLTGVRPSACGGAWALDSEENRASYVFAAGFSVDTADRWIDFAKKYGFGVLHIDHWYAHLGHYPVRKEKFPHGLADLRKAIDRVHAAGLKAGMHILTGCIAPNDAWVTPSVSPDFIAAATYTLAEPLKPTDREMTVVEPPVARHDTVYTYSGNGNFFRVGTELVQYSGVRRTPPYAFTGLVRGAMGTSIAPVLPTGEKVDFLQQHYLAFYPKEDSPLADALADTIAGVFNGCGFDQIYFDGAEGMGTPYKSDVMCRKIYSRLMRSPIAEGGGFNNSWWWRSRFGAWDSSVWGAKRFHDSHVLQAVKYRKAELVQPQLGWWAPKMSDKHSRGHFLDEMEYFACKNVSIDGVCSMQRIDVTKELSDEVKRQLEIFGVYERFRLAQAFSDEALARIGELGKEFRLRQAANGEWFFIPVETRVHRVSGDVGRAWKWKEGAGRRLAFRLEALYGADDAAETPVSVLEGGRLPRKTAPEVRTDLGDNRVFRFKVTGDGSDAVARLQVRSPREYGAGVSDHYFKLDFTGEREFTFPLRERDAFETDFYRPEKLGHYNTFSNPLDCKHIESVEMSVVKGTSSASVSDVRAVPMAALPPKALALVVNGARQEVPFPLVSGEYAEMEMDGTWTRWSEMGKILEAVKTKTRIELPEDESDFKLEGDGSVRAEVTLFALGRPFRALKEKEGKVK